ncbi:MAG: hypothetical protein ACREL9_08845 [Gemmatimonadales bacterium]
MTATAAPPSSRSATDRSDFRTVLVGGTKVGALTAAAVLLCALVLQVVPPMGALRQGILALIVLATAVAASLLPGRWVRAQSTEGVAGAAAMGLWGTVVFMACDIVILRPLNHIVTIYPLTWDAVGGRSTWWYLPIWWMLGTFVAWMGGIVTAGQAFPGEQPVVKTALPFLVGAVVLASLARLAGLGVSIPVAAGGGYTVTLTAFALRALTRKS